MSFRTAAPYDLPIMAQLLSYDEAGDELAVSARTVKRLVAAGELPVVQVGPKSPRIDASDLDAFITKAKGAGGAGAEFPAPVPAIPIPSIPVPPIPFTPAHES